MLPIWTRSHAATRGPFWEVPVPPPPFTDAARGMGGQALDLHLADLRHSAKVEMHRKYSKNTLLVIFRVPQEMLQKYKKNTPGETV